jgi:hypothetical protein
MLRTLTVFSVLFAMTAVTTAVAAQQSAAPAPAKSAAADKHRQEDIAKHRKMAQAHEAAAKCLESGETEAACHEKLRTECQGIAIGKFCGMRHAH